LSEARQMKTNIFQQPLNQLVTLKMKTGFRVTRMRTCFSWLLILALFVQPLTPLARAASRDASPASLINPAASRGLINPSPIPGAPAAAQTGGSIVAFGPQRFDRLPGPPRNVTEEFTAMPGAGYVLRVQNGATDGSARATGATIQLNGALLATARTLNLTTAASEFLVTLQASNTLSVRVTGAPGAYLTISIVIRPSIVSLVPASGNPGQSIMINGSGFDTRAPNRNIVNFTRAGGGVTLAQVTSFASDKLTVIVPVDAATGPVTVAHEGGAATSPTNFTVIAGPLIADFNPKRGPIGTLVTIVGSNLKPGAPNPAVTFTGANNMRLPAAVSFATQTEVRATVPAGAVTGPIELSNSLGSFTTVAVYSVETPQDFQVALAPAAATALQGGTATFVVSLTSNQTSFTQLATLSVTGLPGAMTASFNPQQITAGASSTLTLMIPGNIATGGYNFSVQAKAQLNGSEQTRTASGSVTVQLVSQTTLSGRVLSTKDEPIAGATVSLDGVTATTDAAGSFLLAGIAAGADRPVMVDGRTANAPNRTYPVIAEPVTITAGQANVVPYTFYLPAIDTANEVTIVPNQATNVTTPEAPGLMMSIPANAGLTNRDGTPVTRASLTCVEIDRTPAPLPSNVGTGIVYTAQPGGARPAPGMKIPVTYPNLGGADPGTRIALWNFNHDTVQWYIYGYGNVSADGRLIVPEPGVGLPDFSWHFAGPMDKCRGGNCCNPSVQCCENKTNNPVDLSSGMKIEKTTDISFGGARGGLEISRVHTSVLAGTCDGCPFGRGFNHNYAIRLAGTFAAGGAGRITWPEDLVGDLFSFLRTDPDGTLVFNTTETPHQLGDVIRKLPNGTFEYRYKNGNLMRFSASGQLTAMVDRNNNTTTFSYTGGNLTQITDPVGRSLTLQYSGSRITRITDPLNRVWQYAYDGGGRMVTVTDPLNQTMTYGYDFLSRITSITDKRGNVAKQITYDGGGRVIEQKFPDGGFERYSYTLSGMSVTGVTVTNALGRTKSIRVNGAGQVVGTTDELGQEAEVKRDLLTNLPLERTGPCGCREDKRTYDASGNPTMVTDRLNQSTSYEYEPVFGNVTRMTDRLGRATTYTYDTRGNRISMTNALNQTTTYGYDQFGQMTSMTDALGHTSQIEYDARGSITTRVDALGNRTTMEYEIVGRLTAMVDPLGRRTAMTYDALDRMVTITDAANATTTYEYDPNGNQTKMTDTLNRSWMSAYDAKNRLISSTDPINRVSRMRYNTADEMVASISPSSRTMGYSYDPRGLRVAMKDSLGNSVRFTYDNRRNMTALSDQRNNTTTFSYDELYRVIARSDPLGYATTYEYDAESNVIATVDRLGRRTTVNYDALSRGQQIHYMDARVTYIYDAAGRIMRIDDTQGGLIEWVYDDADRLLSETTPQGVVSYTYNNASQRISMTAVDRQPVTYGYDATGRLRTITQGDETFTYTYDTLSRIVRLDRPNDVKTEYQYDQVNRLSRLSHTNAAGVALEDFQYGFNADDEIDSIASLASATLLPVAKNVSTANAANRIAQFGNANYNFDTEGRTQTSADGQGTTNYEWDARGRLIRIISADGRTVNFQYDALGRRASRAGSDGTISFLHDDVDIILDRVNENNTVEYLNGASVDRKLRQTNPAGDKFYFLTDFIGSTTGFTGTLGNVIERKRYEAFGEDDLNGLSRYGFTGRETELMPGLIFYRTRYYDAIQGRFLSEDPLGFQDGTNLYSYVQNSPVNFNDPFGLEHRPGGPFHFDPEPTRCTDADDCPTLQTKISMYSTLISSHRNWDAKYDPGRHAKDIQGFIGALRRCVDILSKKTATGLCRKKDDEDKDECENCAKQLVATTVVVGGVSYIIWKVVKTCACTAVGGPALGAACALTP
jgi:RHS repeat-associated protein